MAKTVTLIDQRTTQGNLLVQMATFDAGNARRMPAKAVLALRQEDTKTDEERIGKEGKRLRN